MTPKPISFTADEVAMMIQICDKIPVTGAATARLLVSVVDKLTEAITVDAPAAPPQPSPACG